MTARNVIVVTMGLIIVLAGQVNYHRADAVERRGHCPCVGYPTIYQQGDLRVEITGASYNIIEAYYNDRAYRQILTGERNLHVNHVFVSTGNQGLFAVRHGAGDSQLILIGWTPTTYLKVTETSDNGKISNALGSGNGPIRFEWKTANVARLSRIESNQTEFTCLIRWNQSHTVWELLNEQNGQWDPINP